MLARSADDLAAHVQVLDASGALEELLHSLPAARMPRLALGLFQATGPGYAAEAGQDGATRQTKPARSGGFVKLWSTTQKAAERSVDCGRGVGLTRVDKPFAGQQCCGQYAAHDS
ncbi:MAG: hypothetical protein SNJ75_15915 [Gemmataceae bacterium]